MIERASEREGGSIDREIGETRKRERERAPPLSLPFRGDGRNPTENQHRNHERRKYLIQILDPSIKYSKCIYRRVTTHTLHTYTQSICVYTHMLKYARASVYMRISYTNMHVHTTQVHPSHPVHQRSSSGKNENPLAFATKTKHAGLSE